MELLINHVIKGLVYDFGGLLRHKADWLEMFMAEANLFVSCLLEARAVHNNTSIFI